ncbi:nickel-dependent lactate racemase [Microaerobacter geothermalis]|uniref:lactate racemase domain-containing protein n=1 Tax=Microaerobacter geothermalis TaxID=674972 RepID=UPI001F1EEA32|nr:lactate racemase domain-containing protein [Microaerobacter geothermalis]MCF6092657.1 nickel-dependent lactate racemase [Microaerobacter geothermalis]
MTIHLPKFYKIRQNFSNDHVQDVNQEVKHAIKKIFSPTENLTEPLKSGAKIGITVGSRGIQHIVQILQSIVRELKGMGYEPFLIAAMGSHGRGKAEGQREVLHSLGITPEIIGTEIACSSEVVQIGVTEEGLVGLPVYIAKEALEADGVLVVNRVKPHTAFQGPYESGLLKMMAVGMGRQKGASMVHRLGASKMSQAIPSIAKVMMDKIPIIGGIAIVENSYDETAVIQGIAREKIWEVEKELLIKAKSYLPKIPVSNLDLCVIQEMGKNYSGTGIDTNVIGRMRIHGIKEPEEPNIQYVAVLDLTEESHGNANGIGLADFTTQRLVEKMDKQATYLNCMTTGFVQRCAIPVTFSTDRELFEGVIKTLKPENPDQLRIAILKNTLHLDELAVSEVIYQELVCNNAPIERISGPFSLAFTEEGSLSIFV